MTLNVAPVRPCRTGAASKPQSKEPVEDSRYSRLSPANRPSRAILISIVAHHRSVGSASIESVARGTLNFRRWNASRESHSAKSVERSDTEQDPKCSIMPKAQKKTRYRWGLYKQASLKSSRIRQNTKKGWLEPKSERQLRIETLNGYMDWIEEKWDRGCDIYLFTFLFNQMPGKERAMIEQMKGEVQAFYSRLATRIARKPASPGGAKLLPLMVLYPDNRAYKGCNREIRECTVNDGLHFHGACAGDRRGRVKDFLHEFVEHNHERFVTRKLRKVHVIKATHLPRYVTDYALKAIKQPWFDRDDFVVLPRTIDEVRS